MTDQDLIREARLTSLPTPLSLTRKLADALEASAARADQLEKAMRDFEQHGLRCDLNPTMHLADVSSLYSDFVRYLARADESVRGRASAALARVPAEPATEEKDPTEGLPPDLARVLRDQSVIVPQDAAVFERIAEWSKAPSGTASAHTAASPSAAETFGFYARELLALQKMLATMVYWARRLDPLPIVPFSEDLKRANDLLAHNYHTRPPWEGPLKEHDPPPRPTMCPRCEGQRYDRDSCGVCDKTGWLDENGDPWRGPTQPTSEPATEEKP